MKPQEYLYNNILDNNIQEFLRPIDLVYPIFFQSKHIIRKNFITPIGNIYKIISVFANIAYVAAIYTTIDFYRRWNPAIQDVYPYLRMILTAFSNLTLFVSNIINSDLNVDLILRIQSARRTIRCGKSELKFLIIANWGKVLFLLLVYVVYVIYPSFLLGWQFPLALNHLILLFYDLVIVHATSTMKLLRNSLESWLEETKIRSRKIYLNKECYLCKLNLQFQVYWKEMEGAFVDLRKAYLAYQRIFSMPILVYVCVNFFDSLLFLQIFIGFEKTIRMETHAENVDIIKISEVMLTFRMSKNVFFVCDLCYECQKFYCLLVEVRAECLAMVGRGICTKEQRQVYKNVLRMVSQFSKVSPCSVFVVDGAMPRLFAGVLSTYFIVLIQSAFLD